MDVFQLMESCESVPRSQSSENVIAKPKIVVSKPSVQKPQILKRPQILKHASTSKTKPAIVITKPIQKPIAANLKSKQTQNLVKRKTPFRVSKSTNAIASTSGTKPIDSKVMSNERYDAKWYMDSGCSRHMTEKREYLRDYRTLDDAGNVRFGNNETCPIRGYDKITNGQFTISRVAFVEGLKHNLVSISQLVVGTGNAVTFNNQGSVITKEATNKVLLKSERKGSMFPLNLKSVTGGQSLCLLSKANTDVNWLWHRRLAHLNFKDLNKLVAMDLVRGMSALKFDNELVAMASKQNKGIQL
ncbi:hypothetical protein L1887_11842 [Cichorium endivia]|nr:hypothetical protein L1887_11842 [Cichorium endivia]